MPQFDVHRHPDAVGYLLDCQADVLSGYSTRLVVPLQPQDVAPKAAGRLNPIFDLDGERLVMVTQFAAAMPIRELGPALFSLGPRKYDIIGALDVLLTGV